MPAEFHFAVKVARRLLIGILLRLLLGSRRRLGGVGFALNAHPCLSAINIGSSRSGSSDCGRRGRNGNARRLLCLRGFLLLRRWTEFAVRREQPSIAYFKFV